MTIATLIGSIIACAGGVAHSRGYTALGVFLLVTGLGVSVGLS